LQSFFFKEFFSLNYLFTPLGGFFFLLTYYREKIFKFYKIIAFTKILAFFSNCREFIFRRFLKLAKIFEVYF